MAEEGEVVLMIFPGGVKACVGRVMIERRRVGSGGKVGEVPVVRPDLGSAALFSEAIRHWAWEFDQREIAEGREAKFNLRSPHKGEE